MKKGILITLLLMISLNQYSQTLFKKKSDELFNCPQKIRNVYTIDSVYYSISDYSITKKKYFLYKDSIMFDTLKFASEMIFDSFNKKTYFIGKTNGKIYEYNFIKRNINLLSDNNLLTNIIYNSKIPKIDSVNLTYNMPIIDGYNQLQGYKEVQRKFAFHLSIYDINNNKKEILADFSDNIKDNFISEIIDCILLKDKVVFFTGYYEAGDIYNKQYWAVDINTKVLSTIDIPEDYKETYFMSDFREENLIIFKDNYNTTEAIIFNNRLQNIGLILYRDNNIIGFKINNKEKQGNYYKTYLDDGTCMLLLDNMKIKRELALFKIYNNQIINDLENFNLKDLYILKNMIYAKHNYQFEDDYHQAYFNLYRFYNAQEKRNSRLKDVSKLISPSDKENLKLINKALKSLE